MSRRLAVAVVAAAVCISLVLVALYLGKEEELPPAVLLNASVSIGQVELTIDDRLGSPNLTIYLRDNASEPVVGASGFLLLLHKNLSLRESDGAYTVALANVSEGSYAIRVAMAKESFAIPPLYAEVRVRSTRWSPRLEQPLDLPAQTFEVTGPDVLAIDPVGLGVNLSIANNQDNRPEPISVDMAWPEDLNLTPYHYAQLNISFWNCASFRIGLQDGKGKTVWRVFSRSSMSPSVQVEWNYRWEEEDGDWVDFGNISKLFIKTWERVDGTDHHVTLHNITFVRERVDLKPSLKEAINATLGGRAAPLFIDDDSGLPYEFINLKRRSVPQSSDLDHTIGNNEISEGLESFWMYYFGSGDKWVRDFLRGVVVNEVEHLDPGTGMVGLHHYDTRTNELESDTHRLEGCTFDGGPAGDSSPQHGGEEPMYMMLPAAWHFGEEDAIASLERFSRTLLSLNSDPEMVHLHLLIKKCRGTWEVADWNGMYGDERKLVAPSPEAYSDLTEFWWVTPMLGAAVVTRNETLRNEIVERCRAVIDNVIEHQAPDGNIPFVFKMDGSRAWWNLTYHEWSGYHVQGYFIRSAYLMHHLTGDEKYMRSIEKLYDWYMDGRIPSTYTFGSHIIFHAFYTGDDSRVDPLIAHIRSTYPPGSIDDDIYGCIWRLFPYVWNGSREDLEIALEGESAYRAQNWVPVPPGSQYYYYYTPGNVDRITAGRGWTPLDVYGSSIEGFYMLSELGQKSRGLTGRDLLILGFLADVPAPE
jgi:hypothetical protein